MTISPLPMMVACEGPVQNFGQHNRRSVDGDAGAERALQEKNRRAQQPRFQIETLAQIFVCREDIQLPVNRQEHRRDDDQRDGHAEIKLHEAEPALIALARAWRET